MGMAEPDVVYMSVHQAFTEAIEAQFDACPANIRRTLSAVSNRTCWKDVAQGDAIRLATLGDRAVAQAVKDGRPIACGSHEMTVIYQAAYTALLATAAHFRALR